MAIKIEAKSLIQDKDLSVEIKRQEFDEICKAC